MMELCGLTAQVAMISNKHHHHVVRRLITQTFLRGKHTNEQGLDAATMSR